MNRIKPLADGLSIVRVCNLEIGDVFRFAKSVPWNVVTELKDNRVHYAYLLDSITVVHIRQYHKTISARSQEYCEINLNGSYIGTKPEYQTTKKVYGKENHTTSRYRKTNQRNPVKSIM